MNTTVEITYPVLTNGEIEFRLNVLSGKWSGGTFGNIPDGVILGQDNCGNLYLNGKPAKVEHRTETIELYEGGWRI